VFPNDPTPRRKYVSEDLSAVGVRAVKLVVAQLLDAFEDPETALAPMADLQSGKPMLTADKDAERLFKRYLRRHERGHFKEIEFYGEETLGEKKTINLSNADGTYVLVDALDGSDLYERNIGNWCSAATFFTPTNDPGERIRAAIIGLPDGATYFATDKAKRVSVHRSPKAHEESVRGLSQLTNIEKASICFYGQKIANLVITGKFPMWRRMFEREQPRRWPSDRRRLKKSKGLHFRIYNLAGMPMIVKMIDKVAEVGAGIDAVVDFTGQKAHDIVPGAFLAKKAGAHVMDLKGKPISIVQLEELLLKPNSKTLRYIIASSKRLGHKIVELNGAFAR
jgi:fructose-1,6-bisphosphatase/inositol monophosphatase family enzyme